MELQSSLRRPPRRPAAACPPSPPPGRSASTRPPSPASTRRSAGRSSTASAPATLAHGPLLVIAGAGSGKTLTLAARVARLVLAGADPARILLLTFSRRAALEMERRVGRVLHEALGLAPLRGAPRLAWCGTFHASARGCCARTPRRIGLDPSFTVDDRGDSEDLIHVLRQRLGLASVARAAFRRRRPAWRSIRASSTRRRASPRCCRAPFPGAATRTTSCRRLFAAYVAEKQAQRVLDFDDLLRLVGRGARRAGACGAAMAARFDHVLVDEYQDTNRLQAAILLGLKPDGRGLTVVGDDAQSIYSFRAAEVRNILDFAGCFAPPADGAHAGAQLPLDRAAARRLERGHRPGRGAPCQGAVERPAGGRAAGDRLGRGRERAGGLGRRPDPGAARDRDSR